jgi:hypothetical protein
MYIMPRESAGDNSGVPRWGGLSHSLLPVARKINLLAAECFLSAGRRIMKTIPLLLLLAIWMSLCTSCGPRATVSPDLAVVEDMEVRAPPEPDVLPDLVEQDMPSEFQSPPDVVPSSILPGSSCLELDPESISFGGVEVGTLNSEEVTLTACGNSPLHLDGIYLKDGSSPAFSIDFTNISRPPTPEHPLVVHPGDNVVVSVVFMLETHSTIGDDGIYLPEVGELVVDATAIPQHTVVSLFGAAVDINCPTAVIKCKEGNLVSPQTVLHLRGDESYALNGTIVKWQWDVEPPSGAQNIFVPSHTFPNPTLETNVHGVYRFVLTVYDQDNLPSCYPAEYEVLVIPTNAIRVELTWDVPTRPPGTSPKQAADLDLHFVHPSAGGPDLDGDGAPDGWFDIPFDCFWFVDHPDWGSFDSGISDDPAFVESEGGETVSLDAPENVKYKVGVHYFQQLGDPAEASVRVYIYDQLVYETPAVQLNPLDMWEVLTIEWPTGVVQTTEDANGKWKTTSDYSNPYFN